MARQNLENKKYGKLTVIKYLENKGIHPMWECFCECGNKTIVASTQLKTGHTKSCGCLRKELGSKRALKERKDFPHEYQMWKTMRQRCLNKNNPKYPSYGGRGISVSPRWDSFKSFIEDMGAMPKDKSSIGRIDNNKWYEPTNCRWEDSYEQANNTRRNVFLTFKDKTLTVSQWEREIGVAQGTIKSRIYRGWSIERALGKTLWANAV